MGYASEVLADAPRQYLRCSESTGTALADSSGNGNGATLSGATLGAGSLLASDPANAAVTVDAVDDTIELGTPFAGGETAYTAEFLIQLTGTPADIKNVLGHLHFADVQWRMLLLTDRRLRFDAKSTTGNTARVESAALTVGQTYHVVCVVDNGGTDGTIRARLFLDGTLVATGTNAGTVEAVNDTYGVAVGRLDSGTQGVGAVLDEIALYGVALSAARVAAHYDAAVAAPLDLDDGLWSQPATATVTSRADGPWSAPVTASVGLPATPLSIWRAGAHVPVYPYLALPGGGWRPLFVKAYAAPTVTPDHGMDWTTGVLIEPGPNPQATIDGQPPGTKFRIRGVHHQFSVQYRQGDQFVFEPGARVRGSKVLAGWNQDGSNRWWVGGQTQRPWRYPIEQTGFDIALPGYEADTIDPAEVFVEPTAGALPVRLRRVASYADLAQTGGTHYFGNTVLGRWWFDKTNSRIYINVDPSSVYQIRTSTRHQAFYGTAPFVIIENAWIEEYASPVQSGAVGYGRVQDGEAEIFTRDMTLRYATIRNVYGAGVKQGPGDLMEHCDISWCGQLGHGTGGAREPSSRGQIVARSCHIHHNLTLGINPYWEGGGQKMGGTIHGSLQEYNWVDRNRGYAMWWDIDCLDSVGRWCLTEYNEFDGLLYEISGNAQIYENIARYNGGGAPGNQFPAPSYSRDPIGAGLAVHFSKDVEVYRNAVYGNRHAIRAFHMDRGGSDIIPVYELRNLWVHDNRIGSHVADLGVSGLRAQKDIPAIYTSFGNRWDRNTYNPSGTFDWQGSDTRSWDYWRFTAGHDLNGRRDGAAQPTLPSGSPDVLGVIESQYYGQVPA
jgi:hypothetical protein